jgi:hypothetical protein
MTELLACAMMYLAVGVIFFAHPRPGAARPDDFSWSSQGRIFIETLPSVILWPVVLWRTLR